MGKKSKRVLTCVPVAQVGGLPHGSHQPVDIVRLPLAVNTHGLLHRHGDHLLK